MRGSTSRRQRSRDEALQRKMMCWLVSQGSAAMNDALRNHTDLPPRTDLGEQAVRIAEARAMTSAAYASGKPTRLKFWYGKFRRMHSKGEMRDKVDEHLAECSDHKNYQVQRDEIDSLRGESSASDASSPIFKSFKVKVEMPENVRSESAADDEPEEQLRGVVPVNNSDSASEPKATERQLTPILHLKNSKSGSHTLPLKRSGSVSDHRSPLKKLKATVTMKNTQSGADKSPVKKRRRINILQSEPSESDENLPSIPQHRRRI